MAAIQHEFYRSFRGPGAADEDWWSLVFDPETSGCWCVTNGRPSGHAGFDDLDVSEFLEQTGGAQTALIDRLFGFPPTPEREKSCRMDWRRHDPRAGSLMSQGIRFIGLLCIAGPLDDLRPHPVYPPREFCDR